MERLELDVFKPFGCYNLGIRSKSEKRVKAPSQSKPRSEKKKKQQEFTREQRFIVDALKTIFDVKEALKRYSEVFHLLRSVVHKALDLKFSDNDRRLLNKQYQANLRALDELVKEIQIHDVLIFDGHGKRPTISLPLSDDESEVMNIVMSGLDLDSLRLRETRVDSIVHARKVEKYIKETDEKIHALTDYLANKDAALDVKRATLSIPMPDFHHYNGTEELGVEEEHDEENSTNYENHTPQLRDLRERQERAARAKGREFALLVNTRG